MRSRPTARLRMREIRIPHISKCLRHLRRLFNARSYYFMRAGSRTETQNREATQAPRQRHRIPIPALAKRGYGMAKTALPIQPPFVCVALLSRKKAECDLAAVPSAVRFACRCCVCLFAHARPTMPSISLVSYIAIV